MFTTTTTQPVKFKGWTLPEGSKVEISRIVIDGYHYSTASATCDQVWWNVSIPTYALPDGIYGVGLPIERR